MTILSRSPENGDGLQGIRDAARHRAVAALRELEEQWQENVVATTPRWLVAVLVTWTAVAVLVLLTITAYAVLAF